MSQVALHNILREPKKYIGVWLSRDCRSSLIGFRKCSEYGTIPASSAVDSNKFYLFLYKERTFCTRTFAWKFTLMRQRNISNMLHENFNFLIVKKMILSLQSVEKITFLVIARSFEKLWRSELGQQRTLAAI